MKKVVRSLCQFSDQPNQSGLDRLNELQAILIEAGYEVQSRRICTNRSIKDLYDAAGGKNLELSVGTLSLSEFKKQLSDFYNASEVSTNLDLTQREITTADVELLFEIIKQRPSKTFNFTYVFNNPPSAPFFPSGNYQQNGFAVGLQSTDLSADAQNLDDWLKLKKQCWHELTDLLKSEAGFLGIDSSVAPLFSGDSSLVHIINRFAGDFSASVTTDVYIRITEFIAKENPQPFGLCGLMLPCLEDFELAKEYEKGNFSIERNLFLSLHSGLGIDSYPIGLDENPQRILEILKLVQALSNKYSKPLSVRFVSDGKAKISQKTNFQNQYLKDVVIRAL